MLLDLPSVFVMRPNFSVKLPDDRRELVGKSMNYNWHTGTFRKDNMNMWSSLLFLLDLRDFLLSFFDQILSGLTVSVAQFAEVGSTLPFSAFIVQEKGIF